VKNLPMTPAERLTACLDELASSVHRAGVAGEAGSRLLELAALATMKAVELELRAESRNAPPSATALAPAASAEHAMRAAA
jgi:hypothetical protein